MIIDVPKDYNFRFKTSINGNIYYIDMYYNDRSGKWFYSLFDSAGESICEGLPYNEGLLASNFIINSKKIETILYLE